MPTAVRASTPLLIAFLDLTHYSVEAERRHDLEIADTIDAFYAEVTRAIEAANGRVVKFIGDASLVVFPEESIDDGVRAILDLEPVVAQFFEARGWTCRLTAKIHFGTAVAGEFGPEGSERFDVMGRAVNETVKLDRRAGGIVLSDAAAGRISAELRQRITRR